MLQLREYLACREDVRIVDVLADDWRRRVCWMQLRDQLAYQQVSRHADELADNWRRCRSRRHTGGRCC